MRFTAIVIRIFNSQCSSALDFMQYIEIYSKKRSLFFKNTYSNKKC